MAEVRKAVKKKRAAAKRKTVKPAVSKPLSKKDETIRKIAELAGRLGMSTITVGSKMNPKVEVANEPAAKRPYVRRGDKEISATATMSAADKAVIEEHKELYEKLTSCTDLDEFSRIYKRYAELDVKVARLTSNDDCAVEGCKYESRYKMVTTT